MIGEMVKCLRFCMIPTLFVTELARLCEVIFVGKDHFVTSCRYSFLGLICQVLDLHPIKPHSAVVIASWLGGWGVGGWRRVSGHTRAERNVIRNLFLGYLRLTINMEPKKNRFCQMIESDICTLVFLGNFMSEFVPLVSVVCEHR